jgi:transposase
MKKAKEILRLKFEAGLSNHKIARACAVSASTVWDTVTRFEMTGLSWPLAVAMKEGELERRLYRKRGSVEANPERVPDWGEVKQELRHKNVTLRLLWEEYKTEFPDGYQYSWFCERYRTWRKQIDVVMRQEHKLGERVFLDWAGDTLALTDPETDEVRPCYLFVAVLGASKYLYAEPCLSQDLEAFLCAHVRMFAFFGGVPELLVCDYVPGHIIRNQTPGYAPEEAEGGHVGFHEGGLGHAKDRKHKEVTAESKHHDKRPHAQELAGERIEKAAEVAVVELGLLAGRGIVFEHGHLGESGLVGELDARVAEKGAVARVQPVVVSEALVDGGERVHA